MTDDLSIGALVNNHPAPWPVVIPLHGRFVTLVGLDPVRHASALYAGTHGDDQARMWRYLPDGPYKDRAAFDRSLAQKALSTDPLFFTILDRANGEPVGYLAYMRMDPPSRVIEVGHVVFSRQLQRRPGATEAIYLLARHTFDALGYRRFEWKCDSLNAPSRRAAERFGFTFEGIFRQHKIVKGRNRDTSWYAMLDSEWPNRKDAFERWLAASNFDATGQQQQTLEQIRASAPSQ